MTEIKRYIVGGFCRDEILGIPSKDIDYAIEAPSYQDMKNYIINLGGEIFLESENFYTIRAKVGKIAADYVLCRKDAGKYSDGRHPDKVEVGTIFDDLSRRDMTINAIAKDENGNYIDPFNGIEDIQNKIIQCVGNTYDRISEDYLRLLRAARFSITKDFNIHYEIEELFFDTKILDRFSETISRDRVREELYKMFNFDTLSTIYFFGNHLRFASVCFERDIWLKATSENR